MVLHIALGGQATRPIARTILAKYRTVGAVIAAPSVELLAIRGLGKKGVAALKLMRAASINVLRREMATPVLAGWNQLIDYLSVSLMYERIEQFRMLFLDNRGALFAG
jgi:DNA repair protein RadC